MNAGVLLFARVDASDLQDGLLSMYSREFRVVCWALGGIILLLVLWAIFIRKPRRHRHRHHHHHHPAHRWGLDPDATDEEDDDGDANGAEDEQDRGHRHSRRRRRREHRPRNPTLAETGGLPPIRANGPPGTSPP